jgi:hypothetical protein
MNDLLDFVRQHRALTAALVLMLLFAYLALSRRGFTTYLYLVGFGLSFIWLTVFSALSILRSYETIHGEPRLGKPRHGMAWWGRARHGSLRHGRPGSGTPRHGMDD